MAGARLLIATQLDQSNYHLVNQQQQPMLGFAMPFTSLRRLLIATHLDQSNYLLANQQQQQMLGFAVPFSSLGRLLIATHLDQIKLPSSQSTTATDVRLCYAIHQPQETTNSNPPGPIKLPSSQSTTATDVRLCYAIRQPQETTNSNPPGPIKLPSSQSTTATDVRLCCAIQQAQHPVQKFWAKKPFCWAKPTCFDIWSPNLHLQGHILNTPGASVKHSGAVHHHGFRCRLAPCIGVQSSNSDVHTQSSRIRRLEVTSLLVPYISRETFVEIFFLNCK